MLGCVSNWSSTEEHLGIANAIFIYRPDAPLPPNQQHQRAEGFSINLLTITWRSKNGKEYRPWPIETDEYKNSGNQLKIAIIRRRRIFLWPIIFTFIIIIITQHQQRVLRGLSVARWIVLLPGPGSRLALRSSTPEVSWTSVRRACSRARRRASSTRAHW